MIYGPVLPNAYQDTAYDTARDWISFCHQPGRVF